MNCRIEFVSFLFDFVSADGERFMSLPSSCDKLFRIDSFFCAFHRCWVALYALRRRDFFPIHMLFVTKFWNTYTCLVENLNFLRKRWKATYSKIWISWKKEEKTYSLLTAMFLTSPSESQTPTTFNHFLHDWVFISTSLTLVLIIPAFLQMLDLSNKKFWHLYGYGPSQPIIFKLLDLIAPIWQLLFSSSNGPSTHHIFSNSLFIFVLKSLTHMCFHKINDKLLTSFTVELADRKFKMNWPLFYLNWWM